MKKLLIVALLSSGIGAGLFAQSTSQEDFVLEQARAKLRQNQEQTANPPPAPAPDDAETMWDSYDKTTTTAKKPNRSTILSPLEEEKIVPEEEAVTAPKELPTTTFAFDFVPGVPCYHLEHKTLIALGLIGSGTGEVSGAQLASIFAMSGSIRGVQASGVFNLSTGTVEGLQSAGIVNIASGGIKGFQSAGIVNIAKNSIEGFQAAGVVNIAEDVRGFQAAGVVNIAQDVHGMQLGLINIAKNNYGLALGLINISENGISQIDLALSDSKDVRLGYKMGTPVAYTHFYGEMKQDDIGVSYRSLVLGANFGFRFSTARTNARESSVYLDVEAGGKALIGADGFTQATLDKPVEQMTAEERNNLAAKCWAENRYRFAFDGGATLGFTLGNGLGLFLGTSLTVVPTDNGNTMAPVFQNGKELNSHLGDLPFVYNTRWYFGVSL